jgi:hypothetical protein
MTVAEPMTLLTDYALAGVSGWLAFLLWRAREGERSRSLWALAFGALALAAALGGTYHGFAPAFPDTVVFLLWKATVLAIGVSSFAMLAGSIIATTRAARKPLLAVAAAKLAIYSIWMLGHSKFLYVIVDTSAAMAGIVALHAWSALRRRDRASAWMLSGVGLSVLAAAVQAGGLGLHRHFNHNDLYHVIQITAMVLFYLGARTLRQA